MPEVVIIMNVTEHTYAQFNMPQLLFKTQKQIIINPPPPKSKYLGALGLLDY